MRLAIPLTAILIFLTGCGSTGSPMSQGFGSPDAQTGHVQINNDGSTQQGGELIVNYEGRRIVTLQVDPVGAALSTGGGISRGARALMTPASGPRVTRQSAPAGSAAPSAFTYGLAPAVVQQQNACAPTSTAQSSPCAPGAFAASQAQTAVVLDANGNITHELVNGQWMAR